MLEFSGKEQTCEYVLTKTRFPASESVIIFKNVRGKDKTQFYIHPGNFSRRKKQVSLVSSDKNRKIRFKFVQKAFERLKKNLTVKLTGE